jgi:hypothetical protein
MRRWLRIMGLVSIGLVAGAGLGLYLGWVAWPTEFTDANPSVLQESYRRDYALMIAAAYAVDGDLSAAQRRVTSLGEDGQDFLFSLLLDMILRGDNEAEIRPVARLAADLGLYSPAMEPYLAAEPANNEE